MILIRAIVVAAFGVAFLIGPQARAADGRAAIGRVAPRFVLETADGDVLSSRAYAGRPLVLNVFASWCAPCREELPRIIDAARHADERIAFVGVDEQEAVSIGTAFAAGMHVPYTVAFDHGQFAASFGASALPETIFIDARGIVRDIHRGPISRADLERDLATIARPARV